MVATLQAGDTKANCANDWLTFMASLSEVAVAGAAVFWPSLLGHGWAMTAHDASWKRAVSLHLLKEVWKQLVTGFGPLASSFFQCAVRYFSSSQVSEDCNFNKDWLKILHITKEEEDLMTADGWNFCGNWLVNKPAGALDLYKREHRSLRGRNLFRQQRDPKWTP